jgi:hypothetical protein
LELVINIKIANTSPANISIIDKDH